MRFSQAPLLVLLAVLTTSSSLCFAHEAPADDQRLTQFLAAYNAQRADKRLMAINYLDETKEQRAIEMLYFVSVRDADPEVRSRAFSALVRCEDTYGYTAHLAADSFKQEKEFGVKVEKAVDLGVLQYRWAALNELTEFLSTLRWNYWNWYSRGSHENAYIPSGNPPEIPSGSSIDSFENDKKPEPSSAYDKWRNRPPLRWRNENELMGLIAGSINKLSGAQVESRPRIDQEIVKWWERKSELWAEYDKKLRTSRLPKWKDIQFKNPRELHDDGIQPGKDTLRDLLAEKKDEKPVAKVRGVNVEDE